MFLFVEDLVHIDFFNSHKQNQPKVGDVQVSLGAFRSSHQAMLHEH